MEPMMLPKPERISQVQNAGYLFLLTGLAELINSFLRHFLSAFEYEKLKMRHIDLPPLP